MILSFVALLWFGRDQAIRGDNLEYAARLATQGLGHPLLHTPPNKYLIAVPLLVYWAMFETFGIGDYVPYQVLAAVLVLLSAGLFYELVRRRVGHLLALAATVLVLFFGSGWEEVLTAVRLPSLIAVTCGLGALVAVGRRDLLGDVVAAALLCVAVASHPTGVAFAAAVAVLVLLSPSPSRWRRVWVFLAPVAVFAAWYLIWRAPTTPGLRPTHVSDVFLFMRQSWVMVWASVTGLAGVLDAPVYRQTPAMILGALTFAALVAIVALRFRRLSPTFWAALLGLAVLIASTRLSPGGFLRRPDETRYQLPEALLLLLMLAGLAERFRIPRWAQLAAIIVLVFGISANVAKLRDGGDEARAQSQEAVGQLTAYRLAGSNVHRDYTPNPLLPTAGLSLDAMDRFGSAALTPSELANASLLTRQSTDAALVGSLGIELVPGRAPVASGAAPQVVQRFAGRTSTHHGCVAMSPPETPPAGTAPLLGPQLAELVLPPAGVSLTGNDLSRVHIRLGMYAPPSVARAPVSGRTAVLRTPADDSPVSWKLTVFSDAAVSVCGLAVG